MALHFLDNFCPAPITVKFVEFRFVQFKKIFANKRKLVISKVISISSREMLRRESYKRRCILL